MAGSRRKPGTRRRKPGRRSAPPKSRFERLPVWLWALFGLVLIALIVLLTLVFRSPSYPEIDGDRAFSHLERQVEFGPRVPGTEAHVKCRDYLSRELEQYADRVSVQPFTYVDKRDTTRVLDGYNIIASFNAAATNKRVLLGSHWDTRATADQDPDPSLRSEPVPGANDGASGTAILLEVARVLSEQPLDYGVDIVLFDLEDIGDDDFIARPDSLNPFAVGSDRFVQDHPNYWPSFGIILDIVGDRDLRIPMEGASFEQARFVVEKVWDMAGAIGADSFVGEVGQVVYDDHAPFLNKGVPVINVIQWPFPDYWHTTADTPDKCSAESLQEVGNVVLAVLYGE